MMLLHGPVYDHRHRRWRHFDTCGLVTMIEADVPRVSCEEHGGRQVRVPWAEAGIGFTAMFETLAISWLKVAPISAVAERLRISFKIVFYYSVLNINLNPYKAS